MHRSWTPLLVVLLIATATLAATAVIAARIGDAAPLMQPLAFTGIVAAFGVTRIFAR
ncbi:MAG: hypothetical protein ACXWH1_15340 [Thermoanaerobaculia bacterium]